ncbi:uncharacterized protein LOC142331544 [Lycorma delicatula]|uniref:uncharacterized protein LOC142331544 n=1 Tax=Lycorma delicatula TaxID=130591 RepID=UPI003F517AD9
MRYHILLLSLLVIIAYVDGENKNENKQKKLTDKRSYRPTEKKSNGKRELDGQYDIGNDDGTAFSYTHVIQNHGPVRKVIRAPGSDILYSDDYLNTNDNDYNSLAQTPGMKSSDEDDYDTGNYYEPTKEPYFGPIYVTAKPVLAVKDDYVRSRTNALHSNSNKALSYPLPLFRPAYDTYSDKQYSVPIQVFYKVPLQRSFGNEVPKLYSIPNGNNRLEYQLGSVGSYALPYHYINSASSVLPYKAFVNNYFGYTKADSINADHDENQFSEHKR